MLLGDVLDQPMDGLGRPLHVGEALAQPCQRPAQLGGEVLARRLLVVLLEVAIEKYAVARHVHQRLGALALGLDHGQQVRTGARVHAQIAQVPAQVVRDTGRVTALDVVLIEPKELFRVERGGRTVDIVDVEQLDHLVHREDLLIAVRPAQAHQVVEQRLRQVALLAILHDAHRPVALGQALAVVAEDHRHVGVLGRLGPQGPQDIDLARGVVQVIVAANHVGDPHIEIVHDHSQVVSGAAVGAQQDQIVELGVVVHHPAADHVLHHHRALQGILEADHMGLVLWLVLAVAAAPVVTGLLLVGQLPLAQLFQALLGAVAAIGVTLLEQLVDVVAVAVHALGLIEGTFVVLQPQPGHALEDGVDRLGGGALEVGILDAQHEGAAVPARVQP